MKTITGIFSTGMCLLALPNATNAFSVSPSAAFPSSIRIATPSPSSTSSSSTTTTTTRLNMVLDPSTITATTDLLNPILASADTSSSLLLSETEAWVQPFASVLGPFLNIFSFSMLCRVVISWYPSSNLNDLPFSIVVWPTEPLLKLIRGSIPPAFGVDITPIVWLGIFTFLNEILLGQQGLLTMKMKYGI